MSNETTTTTDNAIARAIEAADGNGPARSIQELSAANITEMLDTILPDAPPADAPPIATSGPTKVPFAKAADLKAEIAKSEPKGTARTIIEDLTASEDEGVMYRYPATEFGSLKAASDEQMIRRHLRIKRLSGKFGVSNVTDANGVPMLSIYKITS